MSSQYDQAYKPISEHPSNSVATPAKYNTSNTVPFIYTLDSYGLGLQDGQVVKYSIEMEPLREVVSIELIQASVPINGADLYVVLRLNGYSHVRGNNNRASGGFCVIPAQNPGIDLHYNMRRIGGLPDDNYIYYFPEPSRINRLDIELISPTGVPVEFVVDGHHMFTFEIRTLNRAPKIEARFNAGVHGPWN